MSLSACSCRGGTPQNRGRVHRRCVSRVPIRAVRHFSESDSTAILLHPLMSREAFTPMTHYLTRFTTLLCVVFCCTFSCAATPALAQTSQTFTLNGLSADVIWPQGPVRI